MYACYDLIDVVIESHTRVIVALAGCLLQKNESPPTDSVPENECKPYAEYVYQWIRFRLLHTVETYRDSPVADIVTRVLEETLSSWPVNLDSAAPVDQMTRLAFPWFEQMSDYIRWNTWRTIHWT